LMRIVWEIDENKWILMGYWWGQNNFDGLLMGTRWIWWEFFGNLMGNQAPLWPFKKIRTSLGGMFASPDWLTPSKNKKHPLGVCWCHPIATPHMLYCKVFFSDKLLG
jgi:hypothetical protein